MNRPLKDLPNGCLITGLVIILLAAAGWVSNVIQVISMAQDNNWTAMFIIKIVGIFVAPVGSILGVYGWF